MHIEYAIPYLEALTDILESKNCKMKGADQGAHNWLIYTGYFQNLGNYNFSHQVLLFFIQTYLR